MFELYQLLQILLRLYSFILLAYCIFSFLYILNIVNQYDKIVIAIGNFLSKLCDPVLDPIRKIIPNFGGIDISPIIVFLIIDYVIHPLLIKIFYKLIMMTH